jgi:hypothetical protein
LQKQKEKPAQNMPERNPQACKKWMVALCAAKAATLPLGTGPGAKLKLVTADRPPARRIGRAVFARMEPGRLWINGTSVKGWKQNFAQPPEKKKPAKGMLGVLAGKSSLFPGMDELKAAKLIPGDVLNLAVAPAVPARQVSVLLRSAFEAGFRKVVFLFRPNPPIRAPDPPSTTGYVRLGPTAGPEKVLEAVVKIMELSQKSWSGCKAVEEVFTALGAAAPEERCRLLAKGLIVAIKECNCRGDIDPLRPNRCGSTTENNHGKRWSKRF